MKVLDYIKQSFRDIGITLSDANILTILKPSGVVGEDDVENLNNSQFRDVSVGMVKFIPTLLLRGSSKSVSENGHSKSQSWDIQGIKDYYSLMCKQYGLKDELNSDKPKVTFL